MGAVLRGKPLVVTSALGGMTPGTVAVEGDLPLGGPRLGSDLATLALAAQGVRAMLVRLPPSVHGEGDPNFVAHLVRVAKARGSSGYPRGGINRWAAVHRADAAEVFRLALEQGGAGATFHAVAETGLTSRGLAELIGQALSVPVEALDPQALEVHYGWLARFFAADMAASSVQTQRLLSWSPAHPTLAEDLERGAYTRFSARPQLFQSGVFTSPFSMGSAI